DLLLDGVERAQRLLVPGEERHQVAAVNQAPAEGRFDALLRPRLQLAGERVVEGEQQPPVGRAQQRAAVLRALGEGQQVEGGRRTAQLRHGQALELQRGGEPRRKAVGLQREAFLQHVYGPAARGARRRSSLGNLGGGDRLARGSSHRAHRRLPASSKIGMYISTTMTPMARPMSAIRTGSNSRVNQSTQRASSSSWKAAICSSISPMLPPFSPTASMRSGTGVVRPLASIDCDTL